MTILLLGGTGLIGSEVASYLDGHADVCVLSRSASPAVREGMRVVVGDALDIDFMRSLLATVDTVFLLNPAVSDELVRGLLTVSLIKEAGIERLVYVSMIGADSYVAAPRAAAKHAIERAIRHLDIAATILRPNAVFQNDAMQRDVILNEHVYPTPIGDIGMTMVDVRDVAEVAGRELLRRHRASDRLATTVIDVVGDQVFTGRSMAELWSEVLGAPVVYRGDDLATVEQSMRQGMAAYAAFDLSLVFNDVIQLGALSTENSADDLARMLGRPLRTYRDFALEMVADARFGN